MCAIVAADGRDGAKRRLVLGVSRAPAHGCRYLEAVSPVSGMWRDIRLPDVFCMRRQVAAVMAGLVLVVFAVMVFAPAAAAYDRPPIRVSRLVPDSWGQSTTKAEVLLHGRFPGIRTATCFPVIMVGYASESSFVHGLTRYWDKLACGGSTWSGHSYGLIFDAKGRRAWVIYRLKGVAITALRG